MTKRRTIRIGFLVFDGLQALDLFGPQEVFVEANKFGGPDKPRYETVLISKNGRVITTESGVKISASHSLSSCPPLHTLLIPGGAGSRPDKIPQQTVDWIAGRAERVQRIGSICTGLFILARTGLLDDHRVTTHWHNAEEAAAAFPSLNIDDDALFVREGKVVTAAGITSGIDMALALVEEDMGSAVAASVARELVVFLRRPGGQAQFSSLLSRQSVRRSQFSDLLVWIADHLSEDLSTEVLASKAHLSERHFRRAFQLAHGESPAQAVERIRIEVAKNFLSGSDLQISSIASNVGYRSADAFRRAFERLTGINPRSYRERFKQ